MVHDVADGMTAVGVNTQIGWADTDNATRLAVLDRLAAARVEWLRLDVGWVTLEDQPGQFAGWYLATLGFIVDAARARNIKVLAVIKGTPAWASPSPSGPPSMPGLALSFAQRLAGHFRDRIAAYETWNEPNHPGFWTGTLDQFAALHREISTGIRAGDPAASVVLAGPAYCDSEWVRQMLLRGLRGTFDALAVHPYMSPSNLPPDTPDPDGTNIWTMTHVAAIRSLQEAFGDSSPIWFTEFGWSSHSTPSLNNWERGVTQATQASYLTKTLQLVGSRWPYVSHVFWYVDRDRSDSGAQQNNYGLLTRAGQPKAVYTALRRRH